MMKRKNFFTGSIFQFYVPEIKKYAFCKFFDFSHLSAVHGLLAQVYNKFSDTEDNRIEDLISCDWLFGPRSMHRWPDLRKDTSWKSLGLLSAADDNIVPDFKGTHSFPDMVEDESSIGRWYVLRDLVRSQDCEYSKVKHLETYIVTTKTGLVERTGMEYCRLNNLTVADFYDLEEEGNKYMYWQMINVPIYSTIPKEIRGKVLRKS